jgi:hypothetical protein
MPRSARRTRRVALVEYQDIGAREGPNRSACADSAARADHTAMSALLHFQLASAFTRSKNLSAVLCVSEGTISSG